MSIPGEHKTVQSRILHYATEIGWTFVPREEAEMRRVFDTAVPVAERPKNASLFFTDVLTDRVRAFNPRYHEDPAALTGDMARLQATIQGNRDFLDYLRNDRKYYVADERRELNLQLIDYGDLDRCPGERRNVYEVTEEFAYHNGQHGNREDVVFLINGIPVLVIECKNASKQEAIALGVDQIRRYHRETPELMVPQMLFTATEAIGFSYGVTWNTVRRNIFPWKSDELGNLEQKVRTFCDIPHVLRMLRDFIIFAEKEEELQKFVLRQHQATAVDRVVERALEPEKSRGLVWHTQGSGKTFTMIKAAELLFKAPGAEKPTILLMIDRNELEDQMLRNLASLGMENVEHASSIRRLNELLRNDYRGIIVTMIHKFRDMPADLNTRRNIYVLIDEAHRTTGGDLGNYLMAGLPNASFIGFTGTPVDKTAYGKGTFKTFGVEDEKTGYLHKYSIAESIADGTTLPLYYNLAPNELLVPTDVLDKEFLSLVDTEGIADIEELNRILDRAVNLKNFLKGKARRARVAQYVAEHYVQNVEPLGYKAFLVGVDREACAFYKEELDKILPPDFSEVVYTGNNNDESHLKKWHLDPLREKQIRKDFTKVGENPKILIVTEKLLTGFDAPILYAMYLDKPMRDHTLLQAIARVNRPYEDANELRKPHGFVLDFVGIFDKLERALAFDSDEIDAVIKDLSLLKTLFRTKMNTKVPPYLALVQGRFDDRDVDNLIEHFRDKGTRQEFFKEFKELEMLYEIISPDAFLRPYLGDYASIAAMYDVVRNAYAKRVYVDRDVQRKTNKLIQDHIGSYDVEMVTDFVEINERTIEKIKEQQGGDATKVINLVKLIERTAEEESGDPFLVAMAERARAIQEQYEDRQLATREALKALIGEVESDQDRQRRQAERGLDDITHFLMQKFVEEDIPNAVQVAERAGKAFVEHPYWQISEAETREVRQKVTFAIFREEDDFERITRIVDDIFSILQKAYTGVR